MARPSALLFLLLLAGPAASEDRGMGKGRGQRYYIGYGNTYSSATPTLQLSISSVESVPVTFEVKTLLGYNYQGAVQPNSTTNVTIPNSFALSRVNNNDKGISFKAYNGTVRVHGLNYVPDSADGYLAFPCIALDTESYEYYGLMYHAGVYPSFYLAVGCENSTVVNYGLNTTVLNEMEILYIEETTDYSGIRVTSDKPISFFSGHRCTFVPSGFNGCDHLVEQIPPTAVWGTHFLSASYFTRSSGELYRILTARKSTTVTVNCNTFSQPQTFSLTSTGSWTEFRTNGSSLCSIESNSSLLVMEFTLGRRTDGVSDPFMMMIPSVDQYTNDYVFHSPSEFSNYITILVTPQYYQPEQILVDGVSQENANWAPVHCANGNVCGYCAYVTLEPGDHHVWHSDSCAKMSVLMYGFVYKSSYGHPAGVFFGNTHDLIVPSNFSHTVVEGDPHSVRFTWSPPPEQEQRGEITHYTINCTSESGQDSIKLDTTGLETLMSTFLPAMHYKCFISVCREKPQNVAIDILTIPSAVEGLTLNVTEDEFTIHWDISVGVVSHYVVTVRVNGKKLQFNVTGSNFSLQTENLSEGASVEVNVRAVNDAGVGPSAIAMTLFTPVTVSTPMIVLTPTTVFTSTTLSTPKILPRRSSPSSIPFIVGGSVSAVLVVILVVTAIVVIAFVRRKKHTQASVYSEPRKGTHKMKDLTVDGDKEAHIYEVPHFNPVREEIITTSCVAYGTNRLN